jgi:hypothetical protein
LEYVGPPRRPNNKVCGPRVTRTAQNIQ